MLQNVVLLTVFDDLQDHKTQSTFTGKPNAFLILLRVNSQKGPWRTRYLARNGSHFARTFKHCFPRTLKHSLEMGQISEHFQCATWPLEER